MSESRAAYPGRRLAWLIIPALNLIGNYQLRMAA
jgi:hypothetical protein